MVGKEEEVLNISFTLQITSNSLVERGGREHTSSSVK